MRARRGWVLVEGDKHTIDLAEAAPDFARDLAGLIRAGAAAFAAAAQAARDGAAERPPRPCGTALPAAHH